MTKKDYEILATALAQAYTEAGDSAERKGVASSIEHICHACQIENPRFKERTFKKYVHEMSIALI
jgi:hypothetical protein